MITNKENIGKLAKVDTIEDLKKIRIGSGVQWPDTDILKKAGLTVHTAKYEPLFKLVQANRIDGYARGAHEPYFEVKSRKDKLPDLVVDNNIAIIYPFDFFFFVAPKNEKLQKTIYQGPVKAYADGSFIKHFNNHPVIKKALDDAKLDSRKKFVIPNPLLTQETRNIHKKYWMN